MVGVLFIVAALVVVIIADLVEEEKKRDEEEVEETAMDDRIMDGIASIGKCKLKGNRLPLIDK